MSIKRAIALAFIAGILGVFVGHALPRGASKTETTASATSTPPATAPPSHDCKAERGELSSTKAQLAICKAYLTLMRTPDAAPSAANSANPPIAHRTESEPHKVRFEGAHLSPDDAAEIIEKGRHLNTYPEAVIVRHWDGRVRVYKPDEWASDGDGEIVARKFLDGHIGWYTGPDAGPRSDPAAFQPLGPSDIGLPDGPEIDEAVRKAFGVKVRDAGP
jgi:hypothetical protein